MGQEFDDIQHAFIQNWYVAELKRRKPHATVDIEVPYNKYGSRGFIDILLKDDDIHHIYEVKPFFDNVGEALRQLRKAQDSFKGTSKMKLVLLNHPDNIKAAANHWDMISVMDVTIFFVNPFKDSVNNFHSQHETLAKIKDPSGIQSWLYTRCNDQNQMVQLPRTQLKNAIKASF